MMTLVTTSPDGRALRIAVSGHLVHDDYKAMVPRVKEAIAVHGKISLMADLTALVDVSARAVLDDFTFDIAHLGDFERIAVVGNREWHDWTTRMGNHLTGADMRYFESAQAEAAWAWARGG